MNTKRNEERLDKLAKDIAVLDEAVIHAERASLELFGSDYEQGLASSLVTEAKLNLEQALRAYFIENEVIRRAAKAPRAA